VFFSILSVVSASNVVDNDTISTASNDLNTISVTNNQEGILGDPTGTFTELDDLVKGTPDEGTITLGKDYTYSSGDASSGITINKSITIDGKGYTLDALFSSSIFNISSNCHVILKNINFVNANGTNGGAIKLDPLVKLEVINCNFINNTAETSGGAIYVDNSSAITSNLKISGSTFINNTARFGGAVYLNGNSNEISTIEDSTFINCSVSGDGGAAYISARNVEFKNLIFENNTAGDDGGAVYWEGNSGKIYNITCINNTGVSLSKSDGSTSSTRGGTICLTGSDITVSDSKFILGIAFMDEGKDSSKVDGGALFVTGNNVTITGIEFINCSATNNGGALYVIGNGTQIINCTFSNNTGGDGAALYVNGTDCKLMDTVFTDNTAGDDGVIFWSGDNGVMYNITCINNKGISFNTSSTRGGTICLTGNNVTVNKSNFISSIAYMDESRNPTKVDGGALFITGNDVTLVDVDFENCSATSNGGALYVIGNNAQILNCDFNNCSASDGGVIYVEGDGAVIDLNTISNSNSAFDGGALVIKGDDAKLYNTSFENNTAGDDGGAIFWQGNNGVIYNITCINNKGVSKDTSSTRGGTICLTGSNVTVSQSSFISCSAWIASGAETSKVDGGALFITGNDVNITECEFEDCNASHDGGAIYIIGNDTNLLNCSFKDVSAYNGGAIYVAGLNADIHNSEFEINTAAVRGGSIYVEGDNATISNSTFVTTDALIGGAIYVSGDDIVVDNSSFKYNVGSNADASGGSGGAVYIDGNSATVRDSDFTHETAVNYGGAIAVWGTNANITTNTFENCTTTLFNGGAIYVAGDNATISLSNFTQNKASRGNFAHGGSIDIEGDQANILSCNFDDCESYLGGIIYVAGDDAVIDNSTFKTSTAIEGGAIYVAGENTVISASNFTEVKADLHGGAIYVAGNNADIIESDFDDCSVKYYHGGAIYITGVGTTIEKSNFTSCVASGSESRGGAIDVEGNDTSIYDSLFDENHAATGGAIYVFGHRALIDNSTFEKDTATDGGAIYVLGWGTSISNSTILDCDATTNGGAIDVEGGGTLIESTTFDSCDSLKGAGGSIYIAGPYTTIDNSNFTDSTSNTNGGAILVAGDYTNIRGSNFEECIAKGSSNLNGGGAIYVTGQETHISSSNFTNNKVNNNNAYGGTIYLDGYKATIDGSNFNNSFANVGGIIYINGEEATIDSSTFTNSSSLSSGGAIYVSGSNATIRGSDFANISSKKNGGAIYVDGEYTNIEESSFFNCTVSAGNSGGAIYINDIGTKISYSNFTQSYASSAGAIYINGDYTVIDHSNLDNNHATSSAGAIHVSGDNTILSYNNFTNNVALGNGGALDIGGSNASVYYSWFDHNEAKVDGGAIYWNGGHGDDSIVGCLFTNNGCNDTGKGGGAIYWSAGEIGHITAGGLIKDSVFINNTARNKHGGAIDWFHAWDSVIDNCTFINNHAGSDGGALYTGDWNGGSKNLTISNCKFYSNTATKHGGAIANQMTAAHIVNNTFDGNFAQASGGSIVIKETNAYDTVIDGCYFYNSRVNQTYSGNRYGVGGGSIRIGDNNITISNCVFVNSSANSTYGGSIYVSSSNSRVINVSIENSTTLDDHGGAIYWTGNYGTVANVNITNTSSNSAKGTKDSYGGAIFWTGGNGILTNLTIINSSSNNNISGSSKSAHGGAIYIATGAGNELTNVKIINSSAISLNGNANGGAIYWTGGSGKLDNVAIINSTLLGSSGGAIYWGSTTGVASNINITNSSAKSTNINKDSYGGAIYWNSASHALENITIANSSVNYNYASGSKNAFGGAIYISCNNITLINVDIDNSSAIADNGNGQGGAIYRVSINKGGYGGLENVSISNTYVYGANGGAICWNGAYATVYNLNIINSTVNATQGKDALGGALYWGSATSTLENVYIANSSIHYDYVDGVKMTRGGAIFINSASVTLIDVTVDNSSAIAANARAQGGAIFSAQAYLSLNDVTLLNTFANGQGGAIFWTGNNPTSNNVLIINSSTKVSNTTYDANGGAIYSSIATLSNIYIINSTATDDKNVYGGAIYYTGSTINNVTVVNATAISNNGTSYGGALSWRVSNTKNMYNSSFINNTADLGGAVYRENGGLNVYNTQFVENTANDCGGAIYSNGVLNIYNGTFVRNHANNSGGAIYAHAILCNIYSSSLENNSAGYGGAIYYYNHPTNSRSSITNTNIVNNTAIQGSGIYATDLRCVLENVVLLDNQAHSNKFLDKTMGVDETGTKYISAVFVGYDNLLNGIWQNSNNKNYLFTNVTYWGVNGRNVTGSRVSPNKNDNETWINITVEMYDKDGNMINKGIVVTDINGLFKYTFDADPESNNSFKFYHLEDRYYTNLTDTISNTTIVKIIVDDIFIGDNATVKINLTDGAWAKLSGNVTVTFNDTHNTKIVIEVINGTGYCNNVSGLEVGTYKAIANYTGDLNHVGDVDWYTFRVIPIIDLAIEKHIDVSNKYVNVTDLIRYTIIVTNNGPSNATGVNVSEVLSEYLKLNKAQVSHGYYNQTGGYWYIGDLNKGKSATLIITAEVIHAGEISNFVYVQGKETERDFTNNNATAKNITALPIVDVRIVKKTNITTQTINVTDKIKFTITVTNNGPCNATGVYVNETLSNHLKMISAKTNIGFYDGVTWNIGDLNTTFAAILTIEAEVISNGTIANVVTVTSHENDTNKSNNIDKITNITSLNIVDLTITKAANTTGPVNVTDSIKFTITVTNNGPCDATEVKVTEVLSPHLSLTSNVTTPGHGYYNKNTGVWYIGNLNEGSTAVLTLVAKVISNGTIANVVTVSSHEEDTNKSDNKDNITNITALPIVDLEITKAANTTGPVNVTDSIKFTITVTNNGPCDATDVVVNEVLSPHLKLVSSDVTAGYGYYNVSEGIWHVGKLANQSTAVLTIVANVISNGTIANVVTVTSHENDTDKSNNRDEIDNITAIPIVDVGIKKTINTTSSTLNFTDKVEFTITIYNNGPCNATGVYVSEILDSSFNLLSYNASRGSYDGFSWTGIGTLNVGQTETLKIIAQVAYSGDIDNEVIIYSYEKDTNLTNNRDNISTITVTTAVDLEITKTANTTGPVNVSDSITFNIIVHNKSPNNGSGVYVLESLDPHLYMVSYNASVGSYDNYTWNIGNLMGHAYAYLTIVAKVISAGNISNAVSVKGYDNDTNPSNNNASIDNITALPIVDLKITKTVDVEGGFVNVSDIIKYTITVTNNGPCNATNVNVSEVLSSSLKLMNASTSLGYYNATAGVWYIGTLNNQESVSLTIQARVVSIGTIENVVSVNSTERDTDKSNNKDNITIVSRPVVDLEITKVVNVSGKVNVTDYIEYTITVTNNGPWNATKVNVSEILSPHLKLNKSETVDGYYNQTGGYWYIGDLANQTSAKLIIRAQIISNGIIDNVVTVTSHENDTNLSNNRANVVIEAFKIVDVRIAKSVNVTGNDVDVTDIIKFTVTVYNAGPCNATDVYVKEALDPALKLINFTASKGVYKDSYTWFIGNMSVGDNETLEIIAQVAYSGIIQNEVIVYCNENDTNLTNNVASISALNSTAYVDLAITKTVNVTGEVNVTDYIKFTINVTNKGPCNASGVYVLESLNSHLHMVSCNATVGDYDEYTWNIGYLNVGDVATLTIIAQVISKGTISNVVVVDGYDEDKNASNNNASIENITAIPIVDLAITKTSNVGQLVNVSDIIQYRITVKNNGPCDATNVTVSEVLSPHLNMTDYFATLGSYDVTKGVWYIGNLANQSSVFLIISAKVISNGTIENVVVVSSNENDTNPDNNMANVTTEALKVVDLSITKEVNITTGEVEVTDLIKFTLTVHNAGPCNATNVYVKEALDPALELVNFTVSKYDHTKFDYDGYTWVIGEMAVGDTETMEIVARVVYSGVIENEVIVRCNDNDTDFSNNIANIDPIVSSAHVDLEIMKWANTTGPVNVSDLIEFTVVVHNRGPCNASGVYVKEVLDYNLQMVSFNVTNGTYYDGYTWNIGYLNNNENATLTIIAKVIGDGIISNEVIVDGFDDDTNKSNNNASIENITAFPVVDLEITKTVDVEGGIVDVNDIIQFTITVKNNGPSDATDVSVSEVLSPYLEMITYLTWIGDYDVNTGVWHIGDLNNQESVDLIIQAQVISNGTIANVVTVTSHENDTNESNNDAHIDNITALPVVDLEIEKTSNITTGIVSINDLVEYTITVTNNGPSNATNVMVSEVLASEVRLIDNKAERGYYNKTSGIWHIGYLHSGENVTLTMTVKVVADGIIDNYVTVNSTENDTNPYNNWAEAIIETVPIVDLSIDKDVNVSGEANVTDLIEFTITVTNNGPSNATGVYVEEILDYHLSRVSYNATIGSYDGFTWNIGNFNNGSTATLTIVAEVISAGTIENEVIVTGIEYDTNESNNHADIPSINATAFVDLSISKVSNVSGIVYMSDLIEFTITVHNAGPATATNVLVDEALDYHLRLVSYNATVGSYDGYTWIVGNLDNGSSATLTIVGEVVLEGNISNFVSITSLENDTNESNSHANVTNITALYIVDLEITKQANATLINLNDFVEFTITVHNYGPCDANGVYVDERLSSYLSLTSYNATHGDYDGFTWNIGTLRNGSSAVLTIVAKAIKLGNLSNFVSVTSIENDTNKSNNHVNLTNLTVLKMVDVEISKTVSASEVTVGGKLTYIITVRNNGKYSATNVNVTEILSSHVKLTQSSASQGKYSKNIWNVGTLASGSVATLKLTVQTIDVAVIENSVSVISKEYDSNLSNNNYTCRNVTVKKLNTPIDLYTYNIIYGDDENLVVKLPSDVTGTVNITVGNRIFNNVSITKGKAELSVTGLGGGDYSVGVVYGGDDRYLPNSTTGKFKVSPATPKIKIQVEDIWVWEIEVLNVTVNAPGTVNVTVNGITVEIPLNNGVVTTKISAAGTKANYNGKATWNIINLPAGKYPAYAVYPGNENYTSVSTSDVFYVKDVMSTTVVVTAKDIHVGENAIININVGPKGVTGKVVVNVEGKNYTVSLKNGKASLTVPGLNVGKKNVTVWYKGNKYYLPSENTTTFKVLKVRPPVDISAPDITVGEDGKITVKVPSDAKGTITIEIEGKQYTADVKDGKAVFVVSNLTEGGHDIKVHYSGDEKYRSVNTTGSINVNPVGENKTDGNSSYEGICLSDYPTGNPIFVLLLIILAIGSNHLRRIKK